jgi:hypothetical protein
MVSERRQKLAATQALANNDDTQAAIMKGWELLGETTTTSL